MLHVPALQSFLRVFHVLTNSTCAWAIPNATRLDFAYSVASLSQGVFTSPPMR